MQHETAVQRHFLSIWRRLLRTKYTLNNKIASNLQQVNRKQEVLPWSAAPRWPCVPQQQPCAAGSCPLWCGRLCWRLLSAGRLQWSNDRAERPGGGGTFPTVRNTRWVSHRWSTHEDAAQAELEDSFCDIVALWEQQRWNLHKRILKNKTLHVSYPVRRERSSVGHQVPDLVVVPFSSRLQQPLPQVHEWHLIDQYKWSVLIMKQS